MISGAKMKKEDVVKWFTNNNMDATANIVNKFVEEEFGMVSSENVKNICDANSVELFRILTTEVSQFIVLEKLN